MHKKPRKSGFLIMLTEDKKDDIILTERGIQMKTKLNEEAAVKFNRLANEVEALLSEYVGILAPDEAVKLGEMMDAYRMKASVIFEEIDIASHQPFKETS